MSQRAPFPTTHGAAAAEHARALPVLSEPVFWRDKDELGTGSIAREATESTAGVSEWLDSHHRRDFFRFMAASLALGGASGCAFQPSESIVPYVQAPEELVPGRPLYFASVAPVDGFGVGVLVKSEMGRPIKIEGNPDHPTGLGASDAFIQAELLTLYDPDRSQLVTHNGRVDTWENFQALALNLRESLRTKQGAGLRILTQTIASPTLADQLRRLFEQFPQAKWHRHEPVARTVIQDGCRLAFGTELEPVYHMERADVLVALECDFLAWGPGRLKHARAFAGRREPGDAADARAMNRLYVVESTPSLTGAAADHRLALRSADIAHLAREIARRLQVADSSPPEQGKLPDHLAPYSRWISALAQDLAAARGRSLVLAGQTQPPEVHALAHLVNHALENVGKTVEYLPRVDGVANHAAGTLGELAADMKAGAVDVLLVLDGNPAFDAPAEIEFAGVLASDTVRHRIHLGLYDDETAELCHWHIPQAHWLEAWSDLRASDGTASIQQPLIAPLYKGKSAQELLALFLGEPGAAGLEIVRGYWRQHLAGDFEDAWRNALRDGVIPGTQARAAQVTLRVSDIALLPFTEIGRDALELTFRPDPTVWDGRYANNGWLQELPKPLTRLTWDNAALISPGLATTLGLESEDVVELRYRGRSVRIPVWVLPGQAESAVTVTLGHGRRRAGRVGTGVGVDAYGLRLSERPWFDSGLEIKKTPERARLAAVQRHFMMEGRNPIRVGTLEEYRANAGFARKHGHEANQGLSLIDEPPPQARHEAGQGNAWAMVINLNTCIGCGACVAACQAENNIPIVGREQVLASRELHWIRVDRYFEGRDENDPRFDFQPVPCMHCEKAPCEVVCPVGATTHSAEGLNEMTYNRCVGTRYCSNNCPYKVRRFNFLQYADETTPTFKLMRNPDVTIRPRGVMEKCTYCVQRINAARIEAEMENRPLGGDEVVTACQAACPTRAIVFGNLNDPASAVARARAGPRNYALLEELNTHPRTTYLARLRNPNPVLEAAASDEPHGHGH
jgi:molybdopterin-containing oxidoreductase family iron-sulfur binding subunit